jgi:hypothetical protein
MMKYIGVAIGAALTILGLVALVGWWSDFVSIIKGFLPAIMIFAGVIALIAGISQMQDELTDKDKQK